MTRRPVRSALLTLLIWLIAASGLVGAHAATASAWNEVFGGSFCHSTSQQDDAVVQHAACLAHCAGTIGYGGPDAAPPAWSCVPVVAGGEPCAPSISVTPAASPVYRLLPARAPPAASA